MNNTTDMNKANTINIKGMNKAEVLVALYNNAKPLGLGILHFTPEDMTLEEAYELIEENQSYFDYVNGRVLKVDLNGDEFNPHLYDRDNGEGAAERALLHLLEK